MKVIFSNYCISDWQKHLEPYYKSKLELKSYLANFCQLIASLYVILLQLKLTKLKLEILKSDFQRKKGRYEHR